MIKNLSSHKKHVYTTAADTVGLIIKFYDKEETKEEFEMVIENTENRLKEIRRIGWDIATTRSRWLDCLHSCFKRYPDIVENFSSHFVYGLSRNPRIKGECLTQCLEMLQGATNHLRKNVINGSDWNKEIGMIELEHFLAHSIADNQLAALNFLEKALAFIDLETNYDLILSLIKSITRFVNHPLIQCRQKLYEVVKWLWNASTCL